MKAKIISIVEAGVGFDGVGTVDSNPDREEFKVKPIDCTLKQFLEALGDADDDCCFIVDEDNTIVDIGGFYPPLELGNILSIVDNEIIIETIK